MEPERIHKEATWRCTAALWKSKDTSGSGNKHKEAKESALRIRERKKEAKGNLRKRNGSTQKAPNRVRRPQNREEREFRHFYALKPECRKAGEPESRKPIFPKTALDASTKTR